MKVYLPVYHVVGFILFNESIVGSVNVKNKNFKLKLKSQIKIVNFKYCKK